MAAFRCSMCAINHPQKAEWKTCCECGEPTDPVWSPNPNVTHEEALSKRNHRNFEEYLETEGRT